MGAPYSARAANKRLAFSLVLFTQTSNVLGVARFRMLDHGVADDDEVFSSGVV